MGKELRDEYRRLHGKPATKKSPGIVVCLCLNGSFGMCDDPKNCPCPLHFATWKEYLKSKKTAKI